MPNGSDGTLEREHVIQEHEQHPMVQEAKRALETEIPTKQCYQEEGPPPFETCFTCGATLNFESFHPSWKTLPPDKIPGHAYHTWWCDEPMLDAMIRTLERLNKERQLKKDFGN